MRGCCYCGALVLWCCTTAAVFKKSAVLLECGMLCLLCPWCGTAAGCCEPAAKQAWPCTQAALAALAPHPTAVPCLAHPCTERCKGGCGGCQGRQVCARQERAGGEASAGGPACHAKRQLASAVLLHGALQGRKLG